MKFKVGQEVVIKRNLGERSGHRKNEYYHGGDLSDVPLGTKAIVDSINDKKGLDLTLKGRNNNGRSWYVHSDELATNKEYKATQKKLDSLLDSVLLENLVVEKKSRKKIKPFEPKFNVREEFAVWMIEQFPNLKEYEKLGKKYKAIEKRRDEVYKAAKLACKHGIETTNSCVSDMFFDSLNRLKTTNNLYFNESLCYLISTIECVSANLNTEEKRHYGTELKRWNM